MRWSLLLLLLAGPVRGAAEDDFTVVANASKEPPARVRAAWDRLVARGPAALPRLLEAMDTPDPVAANWLRLAFDRVAGPELKAGGTKIDAEALSRFARDTRRQGRARRLALDTLEQLKPGARKLLLRTALDDPEFRADAIDQLLNEVQEDKSLSKEQRLLAYRRAFAASRDLGQARAVASRLKELGEVVSVADHLGFLRDWYVIGPFDAKGQKGFKSVYPPEKGVDLKATYEGQGGKKLSWKRFTLPESPAGRFPILVDLRPPLGDASDAVAYAYTDFRVKEGGKVEFRGAGDDNLSVWVNGKRVFGFEEYRNGVRLDRHRFTAELRPGLNTVLVKVCQAPFDPNSPEPNWEFLLRVTDPSGKGLTFPTALGAP